MMMKMMRLLAATIVIASGTSAFSLSSAGWRSVGPATTAVARQPGTQLQASSDDDDSRAERKKMIFEEEIMNADALKESAKAWQSMTPQDIDLIVSQMDQMSQVEKDKLKEIGMDPELMKMSMQMMKEDPEMMKSVGKMMESLTPEELAAQSRIAQEQMKQLSPEFFKEALKVEEATIVDDQDEDDDADDDEEEEPVELGSTDPTVIDSMFQVAQLMSQPPSGGVTFQAFSTLPPITVLAGEGSEDLTSQELKECWADGSLGATRVDRAGFERVWTEVQACFSIDVMGEARKVCHSRKKMTIPEKQASVPPPAAPSTPTRPVVGASISQEQLAKEVKNMSEQDLVNMLDQMNNMTPQQEAQMKAMGADPEMMKKAASMMKSNPLMRKAATMMMKNTSPEKLMEVSRQAQQRMANMSPEELKKAMDDLDKNLK